MKRILLATAALTVMGVGVAMADDVSPGGWYVGAGVGGNWVDNTAPVTAFGDTLDTSFDTGWAVTGDVGYRWWDSNFRLGLELSYRKNDVDSIFEAPNGGLPLNRTNADGELTQFAALVNMAFDFDIGEDLNLTLGGGIGAADADLDAQDGGTSLIVDGNDDISLAYQGIAGLAYEATDQLEIFVEYRYFVNTAHDVITYPPPNVPTSDEIEFTNHTATIGLRFFLEPPPTPVEPAVEQPAPMTNYTVAFQKKTVLTAEDQATIQEAADVLKGGAPSVTIEATGMSAGSEAGDAELSERRGDVIKRALVDLGVSADKITVTPSSGGGATVTATQ